MMNSPTHHAMGAEDQLTHCLLPGSYMYSDSLSLDESLGTGSFNFTFILTLVTSSAAPYLYHPFWTEID